MNLDHVIGQVAAQATNNPHLARNIYRQAAANLRLAATYPEHAHQAAAMHSVANDFSRYEATVTQVAEAYEARGEFGQIRAKLDEIRSQSGAYNDMEDLANLDEAMRPGGSSGGAQPISIAPVDTMSRGVLGSAKQITYAPTQDQITAGIQQEQNVLQWQGNKFQTQAFTIDLDVTALPYPFNLTAPVNQDPALPVSVSSRPYAKILIGADGLQSQPVKVDLGLGLRLTGAGNFVSINVGMDPPAPGQNSALITCGARMGFFSAPSKQPVTLTNYIDALPAGEFQTIQRPVRAAEVGFLYGTSTAAINVQVDFLDSMLTTLYSLSFSNASALPLQSAFLTNNCYWLRITNNGTQPVSFLFPFFMNL